MPSFIDLQNLKGARLWAGAAFIAAGMAIAPLDAFAFMRTVSEAELSGLEEIEDSGYGEHYEHPDIGSFQFTSIYLAPVDNEVLDRESYSRFIRPEYIDALTVEFHDRLRNALLPTGLVVDAPTETSLIIETALMELGEYDEWTTGTNIAGTMSQNRIRGGAIMEMRWYAENGQTLVLALRDGRLFETYDPVTNRRDRFTDVKDAFDIWAVDLAGFFGVTPEDAVTN